MKLVIKREQAQVTGMFGGNKGVEFTLRYQLVLTPDETQLVAKYKLEDHPLTWRTQQGQQIADDTIRNMTMGRVQTLKDVTTLLRNEDIVKNACDGLVELLDVVRSFGGEEVVEYPR